MPKRELSYPHQVHDWLEDWGTRLDHPAEMVLIGSGALLLHAFLKGIDTPFNVLSMDVDPVTSDQTLAEWCYDSMIGTDFEKNHGWHVNIMPEYVLKELPQGWETRIITTTFGQLTVKLPSVADLLVPKRKRGEPRDKLHEAWATELGLL